MIEKSPVRLFVFFVVIFVLNVVSPMRIFAQADTSTSVYSGEWVLGGFDFIIIHENDSINSIEPDSINIDNAEEYINEISLLEGKLRFKYRTVYENRRNLGGIWISSTEEYERNYELMSVSENAFRGSQLSGALGVGSTGLHERYAALLRVDDDNFAFDGISGRWADGSFKIVNVNASDFENIAVSESSLNGRQRNLRFMTTISEEGALEFSYEQNLHGIQIKNSYSCTPPAGHLMQCTHWSECSGCSSGSSQTVFARKLVGP